MSRKSKVAETIHGYNVTITGRHVQVTDGMKDHAIDKLSKIERFSDRIIDAVVTMDIQKLDHKVDIVLKVDHIKIKAQATTDSMYTAIDKATAKLQSQLLKYKDKLQTHQAKAIATVDMNVHVFQRPDEVELVNEEIEEENLRSLEDQYRSHSVIKKETRPLKILMAEEAIMKMELSGDLFLIFRDEEDQKIKVIYRRADGNYGIIETE